MYCIDLAVIVCVLCFRKINMMSVMAQNTRVKYSFLKFSIPLLIIMHVSARYFLVPGACCIYAAIDKAM